MGFFSLYISGKGIFIGKVLFSDMGKDQMIFKLWKVVIEVSIGLKWVNLRVLYIESEIGNDKEEIINQFMLDYLIELICLGLNEINLEYVNVCVNNSVNVLLIMFNVNESFLYDNSIFGLDFEGEYCYWIFVLILFFLLIVFGNVFVVMSVY